MEGQNNATMPEGTARKSWLMWVVLIIAIVLAAVFIFWQGPAVQAPEIGTEDTTSAIDTQLESIDLGDLEAELGDIDAELNQL